MSRMPTNQKTRFVSIMIVITMMTGVSEIAVAQNSSFYVGAFVGAEHISFEHAKTVDNTNVPTNYLQRGSIYNTRASASGSGSSTGFLIGNRPNLDAGNTLDVGLEIDGQLRGGTASGSFPGDGQSDGRNQYGEAGPMNGV